MKTVKHLEADVVIAGSGPGGATAARQLARAGRRVVILEMGRDWRKSRLYGTYTGCLFYTDRHGLLFSEEGLNIIRGILTGGSTNLYCGTASPPPEWLREKYGVDVDAQVAQTMDELKIGPIPWDLIGDGTRRCLDAANGLGLKWDRIPKFINPDRCKHGLHCGAHCMLGCRCGAKWTANEYLDDAVAAGANLMTGATVEDVIIENGAAAGIRARVGKEPLEVRAPVVVLAAGGLGTPLILQRTGFPTAGRGMLMDPTVMVYGVYDGRGTFRDPPMGVGSYDDSPGYILSSLIDPWLMYPLIMSRKGLSYPFRGVHYRKMLGIMIKVKDEIAGGITFEGRISKPMTDRDRQRLNHASVISRKILMRAGCAPESVCITPIRGTHPSGTVRLGEMLDTNLQTEVSNLYVCDASIFPEALDRPIVLTVIGLSKRLSEHILSRETAKG